MSGTLPDDLSIARAARLRPIEEVAADLGLERGEIELYGRYKAKVDTAVLGRLGEPRAVYVVVTSLTPTPLGEGKTVTTLGLAQALCRLGRRAVATIRQPSLGPVFGVKGGAAGGGRSQVVPMEDVNLHLTGDSHAVTVAHNLLASFVDNHLARGTALDIDPAGVTWPRVLDISDAALRDITVGQSGKCVERRTRFDITAASEVMAVLALARDLADLRRRLGEITVAHSRKGRRITAEDLRCAGAMAVLLREALKPNLLQTLEGGPCFVHAGPFANIAHGNSSVIADLIACRLADVVVTESGFGADCGAEKFFNIKCRVSGLTPHVAVLVATVRALKAHSGRYLVKPGRRLDPGLREPNPEAVAEGAANLEKQIENVLLHGVPVVVAVNRFDTDTDEELGVLAEAARRAGASAVAHSEVWARGGEGGLELAEAVLEAASKPSRFRHLYELDWPLERKIETIARRVYGAAGVEYAEGARRALERIAEEGFSRLPVCMAKTQFSLSHDPALRGRPTGFTLPVVDVSLASGAGFVVARCGEVRTMPGLPGKPAGERIDIGPDGNIVGLS